jgi:AraC-like DNA-binding protein
MVDLDFFADSGPGDIDLRRELLVKGKRICHHIKDQPRLCEMVFRAYEELRGEDKYYKSVIKAIMCELFASLLRCNLQSVRANEPDSDTVKYNLAILPALQRIFSDYKVQLTVDELAELCGISKYHFCRIFKRQMGCTVMQYIMNYSISHAELMLKENSHSIKEISDMCGFEDVSYFHRCYKRIKGVTPSKVRI